MTPGILIPLGLAVVGFIGWLVRLESKANTTAKCQDDFERSITEDLSATEKDFGDLQKDFNRHIADVKMHHNEEANLEFRQGLERRLSELDFHLKDIGRKLNHMAGRE